jgi:hypothetical protein
MSKNWNPCTMIDCSVSKAILSGSKNRSQNNLELQELQNPTQNFIHSRSADKTKSNAEYTRKYFDGVAEGDALSCSRRSLANN